MELRREETQRDFELAHGCVTCGGALAIRVTPGTAHAVCRSCRSFSAMRLVTGADGVSIVQRPAGEA